MSSLCKWEKVSLSVKSFSFVTCMYVTGRPLKTMGGDQCQNLQLFLFSIKIINLHGEILHTNDTLSLICTVKFYIQMILSHLHGEVLHTNNLSHLRGEVLHTNESFYIYKWKFYIQMRSSIYKWKVLRSSTCKWRSLICLDKVLHAWHCTNEKCYIYNDTKGVYREESMQLTLFSESPNLVFIYF